MSNMKLLLLLAVCLSGALLHTAESLRCHECEDDSCSSSVSVQCPIANTVCKTVTSVKVRGPSTRVTVSKNCSSIFSCFSVLGSQTQWSLNLGLSRETHTEVCCMGNNCNSHTLKTPTSLPNGKECPACGISAQGSQTICNTTLACVGAEDRCFSSNTTVNSTDVLLLGCVTKNLCRPEVAFVLSFTDFPKITCSAPGSFRLTAEAVTFALALYKVLV